MENKGISVQELSEEGAALINEFWMDNCGQGGAQNTFKLFMVPGKGKDNEPMSYETHLPEKDCGTIRTLCNNSEVLIFNFYATLFSIFLNKYFSLDEISFLCPYNQFKEQGGRGNFFLFKSRVDPESSFKEMFSENKAFLFNALRYNIAWENIRGVVDSERLKELSEYGLTVNCQDARSADYSPDLLFVIIENEKYPLLRIEYNDRFYIGFIELFANNFKNLINEAIQKIYEPVCKLVHLNEFESKLLMEFNATKVDFPKDKTIVGLIQDQVERMPDAMAIICGGTGLTYRELNDKSNQLGDYLRKNYGIEPDDLIGIKLDRNEWIVIAILGVFKSGGAYIPIDPEYPDDRISYILSDSQCKLVIDAAELEKFRSTTGKYSKMDILPVAQPKNLAYVIYTSGSTGKPKGVMIEHLGMLNHMYAKINLLNLCADSIVVQNASQSFDISVWQFFSALLCGGKVLIYGNDIVLNPLEFMQSLELDKPTVMEVVPSYLSLMLNLMQEVPGRYLDSLQYMVVTGEELRPGLVAGWFDLFPEKILVNAYGPTEASDDITHCIIDGYTGSRRIPVGKVVQNFNIYIADEFMQLCPIGVQGEIYVSGPGVGRGYLRNVAKTEEVFKEDPFREEKGVRMYKTGDVGRWLPDGNIEFFGRKDDLVKIHGHRIELGEIESTILEHDGIDSVIVLTRTSREDEPEIVAYIVGDEKSTIADLKAHLGKTLPVYMIPAHFVRLPALPLTPNGKIDKKRLPDPERAGMVTETEYVAPGNEIESKLVEIWSSVLGLEKEKIGVRDNFFESGGHSLKAIRLASLIHREFEVKIALKDIFMKPSIHEIAIELGTLLWVKRAETLKQEGTDIESLTF